MSDRVLGSGSWSGRRVRWRVAYRESTEIHSLVIVSLEKVWGKFGLPKPREDFQRKGAVNMDGVCGRYQTGYEGESKRCKSRLFTFK